ncbi:protein angel-like isoform X2 [Epargyreus clarus]|uniref:protein angel-like isoform X2 n=1 Tax=Epargyreus clarus TaxID=520877 RepID=UPI003C2F932B
MWTATFCRYTRLTCENINYNTTHVKRYSHLSCRRKSCVTLNVRYSITDPFTHTHLQSRLLVNIRKRFRLKRPQNSVSAAMAARQLNNQLLPSVVYVSPGGDYEDDDENSMDWDAFPTASTSTYRPINKRRDKIPLDFRKWEHVSKKNKEGDPFRFRVVSYNVLAQYLLECHPYLYTDCDPQDLEWKVRSDRIFKEIMDLDPDILCLQEVQSHHIKSFYSKFEKSGYYGIYKQKTGHREDGCAIYFKRDVFDMDDHLSVEYYQPEMPLLNRDNVGLMMRLVPRDCPQTSIVVATTHLLYNPKRTDVRLAQMQVLLAELDRFAYYDEDNGKDTGYYPIILTGDFNSIPESAPIKLLDTGKISSIPYRDRLDWRRVAITDNCQHLSVHINRPRGVLSDFSMVKIYNSELAPCNPSAPEPGTVPPDPDVMRHSFMFNTPIIQHPLKLASVYPRTKPNKSEEATTFQDRWITVDYMYFSCCNKLKLLERLRLPTALECQVLGSLPNDVYGSDHLVLAAHFEIRENTVAH